MLIVTALNISGLADVSDYDYEVKVNRRTIASGRVTGHTRADGWAALLRRIADTGDAGRTSRESRGSNE